MSAIRKPQSDPLELARSAIENDPESPPDLATLARAAGTSASQFTRRFRARFGLSPKELAQSLRRDRFKHALRNGEDVTDAIYAAGYGSPSRVYERTAQLMGMTPGSYRRGADGLAIRYTVVTTALGRLLVATTDRGICAVTLGDDADALVAQLASEFPRAQLARVDEGADEWLAAIVARVARELDGRSARTQPASVPADLRATAFQWQVWQALMRIPRGQTRSYGEIAREIGRPTAVRAVARACASNRLALVVPCHRVIRDDGSLGGYRWGVPRKELALRLERHGGTMAPRAAGRVALSKAPAAR